MMTPTSTRTERDTFGPIEVPSHQLWGAQTQRSLQNFDISGEQQPREIIKALAQVKRASAVVNQALGLQDAKKTQAIADAADAVIAGKHPSEFPLVVWQTGSGTQTNMNVNEVLANRASEILGGERGESRLVHPNDDVNRSQSSNDVFPTAMHVAAVEALTNKLLPAIAKLRGTLAQKAQDFDGIVKIGRTHLQDATPLTLGQEFSGYVAQLDHGAKHVRDALPHLCELALGGTAVGTGLNAPADFGPQMASELAALTGLPLLSADNKFAALSGHEPLVSLSGALKTLAVCLMKLANDLRLLGSGPRTGLAEVRLPANEPGSSIMPGKVNPTQCEALSMIACQVLGNDVTLGIAASQGQLQLNVFKPVIIYNLLQSIQLLADGCRNFQHHCIDGLEADAAQMALHLQNSLMLVRAAALTLGYLSGEQFDNWVRAEQMLGTPANTGA